MKNVYAYIRVSTKEQNTDRQHEALKEYATSNNLIYKSTFEDRASGKDFNRPQYLSLKETVKAEDTIIIKELDRLGRNFMDTPKELQYFFEKGVKVIILDTPLVSTGDTKLDYTINNMLINFLSYIADKESEKIQGRVIEGLRSAKAKGVKLGRPGRTLPKDFKKYYTKWKAAEITAVDFAKVLNISRATLYRHIREYEVK
ncbi:recombinase family protein [Clostridium estertheticum]|uniref:recombinase family protein n=1 Tax=Clostridium estertheticum TaxID=238834 RepID=UPI001C7D53FB|nr:recombinase family protein [Clostridium estertheticum]MBX4262343.1 recombinase family protein [Clostridium estertheticum]WLC71646.1 recombinase family protein [Clostridium estertheticum]